MRQSTQLWFHCLALGLALGLAGGACATEIAGDEDDPQLDELDARTSSCADSPPDNAGFVWLNYRAQDIGCGFGTPDTTAWVDGFQMKGRILCAYDWLRQNDPAVWTALGHVSASEQYYEDNTTSNPIEWVQRQAWYTPFDTGGKIQFQFFGPCGSNTQNGYLKVYVKLERQQQTFDEKYCRLDAECPAGDDGWGHCDYDPEKARNVCKRKRCTDDTGCPAYGLHLDPVTYCKDTVYPGSTYCGPSNSHQPCQGPHAQYTVTYSYWNEAEGRCKTVGGLPLITCTGQKVTVSVPAPSSCPSRGFPHYDNACVAGPRATGTYLNGYDIPVNAFRCAHQ